MLSPVIGGAAIASNPMHPALAKAEAARRLSSVNAATTEKAAAQKDQIAMTPPNSPAQPRGSLNVPETKGNVTTSTASILTPPLPPRPPAIQNQPGRLAPVAAPSATDIALVKRLEQAYVSLANGMIDEIRRESSKNTQRLQMIALKLSEARSLSDRLATLNKDMHELYTNVYDAEWTVGEEDKHKLNLHGDNVNLLTGFFKTLDPQLQTEIDQLTALIGDFGKTPASDRSLADVSLKTKLSAPGYRDAEIGRAELTRVWMNHRKSLKTAKKGLGNQISTANTTLGQLQYKITPPPGIATQVTSAAAAAVSYVASYWSTSAPATDSETTTTTTTSEAQSARI